ncbi:MAG: hypothetical protein WKF34_02490 [Pyrinomonadaceae bacterium]
MRDKYFQILAIALSSVGLAFIGFLYLTEPRSLAEVTTKGQVALGTYEIDRKEFEAGLASFRVDDFINARAAWGRADPEGKDAATQFYTTYSYYRQGWGRFSNDDVLFQSGVTAARRVTEIDPNFRVADQTLAIKTPLELKAELEEGLKITTADFNPLRLTRERK